MGYLEFGNVVFCQTVHSERSHKAVFCWEFFDANHSLKIHDFCADYNFFVEKLSFFLDDD